MGSIIKEGRQISTKKILAVSLLINILTLLIEAVFALKGSEWVYSFTARLIYAPLSITFMFIFIICAEKWNLKYLERILKWLGKISLELYLTNQKFIALGVIIVSSIGVLTKQTSILIGNIIGIIVTVIVSFALHYFLTDTKKNKLGGCRNEN